MENPLWFVFTRNTTCARLVRIRIIVPRNKTRRASASAIKPRRGVGERKIHKSFQTISGSGQLFVRVVECDNFGSMHVYVQSTWSLMVRGNFIGVDLTLHVLAVSVVEFCM